MGRFTSTSRFDTNGKRLARSTYASRRSLVRSTAEQNEALQRMLVADIELVIRKHQQTLESRMEALAERQEQVLEQLMRLSVRNSLRRSPTHQLAPAQSLDTEGLMDSTWQEPPEKPQPSKVASDSEDASEPATDVGPGVAVVAVEPSCAPDSRQRSSAWSNPSRRRDTHASSKRRSLSSQLSGSDDEEGEDGERKGKLAGTLVDEEQRKKMKAKRASMAAPHKSIEDFSDDEEVRTFWDSIEDIVNGRYFEVFFCILIISNTMFLGVEVEYVAYFRVEESPFAFYAITQVYIVAFIIEIVLRLMAHRSDFFCSADAGWNAFDGCLVLCSVLDSLLGIVRMFSPNTFETQNMTYIRMIRILKTVRIFRVFRIMRFFRSLRILVYSVLNTLRSLFWTMLLLTLILYIFGILFTQATVVHLVSTRSTGPPQLVWAMEHYYGSLLRSIFTLFKTITGGVTWQEVCEPLGFLSWMWAAMFVLYVSFTSFAVLNVVTGVFCETAIESAQEEQDEAISSHLASKEKFVARLTNIFKNLDADKSGSLTIDEFEKSLEDETLRAYFASMDLGVQEAWTLFKLLDTDGSHIIDIDEFVSGCLRLRGNAKSIDIAMLTYESRWMIERFSTFTSYIDQQFELLWDHFQEKADREEEEEWEAAEAARLRNGNGELAHGEEAKKWSVVGGSNKVARVSLLSKASKVSGVGKVPKRVSLQTAANAPDTADRDDDQVSVGSETRSL
mmetsp:Transcript_27983/g.63323  ORF Transcript_27983/g.63323 Transcript_27983/m.63323 type:complete len:731 (-) Transcript_27983:245-2437(-)